MDAIVVAIASGDEALHARWAPWLMRQSTLALCADRVDRPDDLAAYVARVLPDVLLLDRDWFDRLDRHALQCIRDHQAQVHVLLVADAPYPGVVTDVLRHGFQGFLQTACAPDTRLQAIHAVSDGELWLSRAALAATVTELLARAGPDDPVRPPDAYPREAIGSLTPREAQIVMFIRRGCTNKEIAVELGIMEDTVKKHLQKVFAKLGVHRRALLALGRPSASE